MSKISVRGIIENEGKFLLVRHKADDGYWCLPGGGIEPNEDLLSALQRELIEETCVKPVIGNLIYIHQIKSENGYSNPGFFFHVKNPKDYLNHDMNHSSHGKNELVEMDWFDITKITVLPKFLAKELPDIAKNGFNVNTRIRLE